MTNKLLPIEEYAKRIGVHPNTVHKMIKAGRLPTAIKLRRAWGIPEGTIPLEPANAVHSTQKQEQATPDTPQHVTTIRRPHVEVPDSQLTLKALALVVNAGDANEAQEAQFARRIKALQSVNAVAILKGVVWTVDEIKAQMESIAVIDEKIQTLDAKDKLVEDREAYIESLQKEIDNKQSSFRKEKRKWESIIEDFKMDLATLKGFYASIVATQPDAEKNLLPKLKLSETFYANNIVEKEPKDGWSDKEKAELEVGEDD